MFEEMSFSIQRAFLNYARNSKTYNSQSISLTCLHLFESSNNMERETRKIISMHTRVRNTRTRNETGASFSSASSLYAADGTSGRRHCTLLRRPNFRSLSLSLSIRLVRDDNSLALFLHLLIPKREYSKGEQRWINNWPFIIPPPYRRL